MKYNYAEAVVRISKQSSELAKAQRNGNKALMISIATQLVRLNSVLVYELEKVVA